MPLPKCDCTARCGDDARLKEGTVTGCIAYLTIARSKNNANIVASLLTELGFTAGNADMSQTVAALNELKSLRKPVVVVVKPKKV
jgi:hypothetical protein